MYGTSKVQDVPDVLREPSLLKWILTGCITRDQSKQ